MIAVGGVVGKRSDAHPVSLAVFLKGMLSLLSDAEAKNFPDVDQKSALARAVPGVSCAGLFQESPSAKGSSVVLKAPAVKAVRFHFATSTIAAGVMMVCMFVSQNVAAVGPPLFFCFG